MNRHIAQLMLVGKRLDGRKFDEFRKIQIQPNIVKKAEGSCLVNLGNTSVVAGVKLDVKEPFEDSPNEGILIVNAEFSPVASPFFEPGPPDENSIELARVVDRGIRESKIIELDKLCIESGKKVWCIMIDIQILNDDGNLLDASFLASLIALKNTKIPKYENDKIIYEEKVENLPLKDNYPVMISVCKFDKILFLDPNYQEEEIVEGKISICLTKNGKITSIQKQGSKEISFEEIFESIDIVEKKSKEIIQYI